MPIDETAQAVIPEATMSGTPPREQRGVFLGVGQVTVTQQWEEWIRVRLAEPPVYEVVLSDMPDDISPQDRKLSDERAALAAGYLYFAEILSSMTPRESVDKLLLKESLDLNPFGQHRYDTLSRVTTIAARRRDGARTPDQLLEVPLAESEMIVASGTSLCAVMMALAAPEATTAIFNVAMSLEWTDQKTLPRISRLMKAYVNLQRFQNTVPALPEQYLSTLRDQPPTAPDSSSSRSSPWWRSRSARR